MPYPCSSETTASPPSTANPSSCPSPPSPHQQYTPSTMSNIIANAMPVAASPSAPVQSRVCMVSMRVRISVAGVLARRARGRQCVGVRNSSICMLLLGPVCRFQWLLLPVCNSSDRGERDIWETDDDTILNQDHNFNVSTANCHSLRLFTTSTSVTA